MKATALLLLLSVCSLGRIVAEDAPLTLEQMEIPREEIRQQVLFGLQEYRYHYALTPPPVSTDLFAECFVDGQVKHRFRLANAMPWQKPEYAKGILSVGWLPRFRELVVLNDNNFRSPGVWVARVGLPQDLLTSLSYVVYSRLPIAEKKQGSPDTSQEAIVYPIIALVGEQDRPPYNQPRTRSLSTTADLLKSVASDRVKQCVIIYMYFSMGGGDPPLHFDEPQSP